MESLVIRQNIEHYKAMLKIITEPVQRSLLEGLLRDEKAKLKKYEEDHIKVVGPR